MDMGKQKFLHHDDIKTSGIDKTISNSRICWTKKATVDNI